MDESGLVIVHTAIIFYTNIFTKDFHFFQESTCLPALALTAVAARAAPPSAVAPLVE
jgi:hypothetical protein